MARVHGATAKVYLGGYDRSGDISSISPKFGAAIHDVTTFASAGWSESDPGLAEWGAEISAFYDPAVGGIGRQVEDLLGAATGGVLSVYDGNADAIGDTGLLFPEGVLSQRGQAISVADLIKLELSITGSGRPGLFGKLLHPKGEETITGTETSLDNGAATANGYRANLHVTAITGSWTIAIEHSSDNGVGDPWEGLVWFASVTAAGGVTTEMEAGTAVKRYLRVTSTEDEAGSCTFICGLARY